MWENPVQPHLLFVDRWYQAETDPELFHTAVHPAGCSRCVYSTGLINGNRSNLGGCFHCYQCTYWRGGGSTPAADSGWRVDIIKRGEDKAQCEGVKATKKRTGHEWVWSLPALKSTLANGIWTKVKYKFDTRELKKKKKHLTYTQMHTNCFKASGKTKLLPQFPCVCLL